MLLNTLVIVLLIILVLFLIFLIRQLPLDLWMTARAARINVSLTTLLAMRVRKADVHLCGE